MKENEFSVDYFCNFSIGFTFFKYNIKEIFKIYNFY